MMINPCTYFVKEKAPPKLVGHLNRKYGYNHFVPLEVGTPVYEGKNGYYMMQKLVSNGLMSRIYFNKGSGFEQHFNRI